MAAPLEFDGERLRILDQTRLPHEEVVLTLAGADDTADAIRRLAVRGAPLIGVAAGYGLAMEVAARPDGWTAGADRLRSARPTAANLAWAVDRVRAAARRGGPAAALAEARAIEREDRAASEALARHGADALEEVLPDGPVRVMTHCNSGALAASGRGTGLGVICELADRRPVHVLACEARPLLQGARLTVWELRRAGIPHELVVDAAAPGLIRRGEVDAVVTGFDRVAANGDVANKVGTYPLALAARAAGIPFVAAGPSSSVDAATPTGAAIEIEERDGDEVRRDWAPAGTPVRNPAFDVTPAELVWALVTEQGGAPVVRVARTVAPGVTRVEEVPDPVAGPGEVVCRVLACATCGSDVQDWYVARKLPAVLGHEPAGEVVEVGAGVSGVAPGDRVAIHHHAPCGRCPVCERGHETLCPAFRSTALDPGGFSELVRLEPELVAELLPLDGMDPVLATFVEPLGCVLRSRRHLTGRSLLVVGAGCSGLLHVAAARAQGTEEVWAAEPDAARLRTAEAWGAAEWDGRPVDAAVACTPRPDAIARAASALGPGGRLVVYAPPEPGTPLPVDASSLFLGELSVTASWSAGPRDMRGALDLLRSGAVDPLGLVGLRVGLEDTGRALAAQKSGEVYKAVVLP